MRRCFLEDQFFHFAARRGERGLSHKVLEIMRWCLERSLPVPFSLTWSSVSFFSVANRGVFLFAITFHTQHLKACQSISMLGLTSVILMYSCLCFLESYVCCGQAAHRTFRIAPIEYY